MKVLIVKTSSMGDLVHTLPAVTDAARVKTGIRFDWVAEQAFAEIPAWHPAVERVIPVSIRRWRKGLFKRSTWREIAGAVTALRAQDYDCVIDAQGLVKSAILTRLCRGRRCGLDGASCREPLAALAYQSKFPVPRDMHAIDRVRVLFSEALGYRYDSEALDYGLVKSRFDAPRRKMPYVVFLHGSSWPTKLWPVPSWRELAEMASSAGHDVLLPWGSEEERMRADEIADGLERTFVLPRKTLEALAGVLAHASGVVGVDTGLAHLAAALGVPGVTLYLSTYPRLTGARGMAQTCMAQQEEASRCLATPVKTGYVGLETVFPDRLSAKVVWEHLRKKMNPDSLKESIINGS